MSVWTRISRNRTIKRALDVVGATTALAITAPIMLGASAAILVRMGRPILFRQQRPGRLGEFFEIYKFRTMLDAHGPDGKVLPDAERLTKLGRFLRETSIDELPELLNVLEGSMSLVGPRPLFTFYLPRYSAEQNRRHEVKPGITGWVQVRGRNALSWQEKFALDVWYVDNWSLWLDLKILAETFLVVLRREGISHGSHPTMPIFMGNDPE